MPNPTSALATQSVTAPTKAALWSRWGSGEIESKPLTRRLQLWLGRKGSGKTTLGLTCRTGLVVNFDMTETPIPRDDEGKATFKPQAGTWPILKKGTYQDELGRPVTGVFGDFSGLFHRLREARKKGLPVPTTIFIDTLPAMLRSCITTIKAEAKRYHLVSQGAKNEGVESLAELSRTDKAYGTAYDMVGNEILSLWTEGFGVVVNVHLLDVIARRAKAGSDEVVEAPSVELIVTDKCLARFLPFVEVVGSLEETRKVQGVKSVPVRQFRTECPNELARYPYERLLRPRKGWPSTIDWTPDSGWSDLESGLF